MLGGPKMSRSLASWGVLILMGADRHIRELPGAFARTIGSTPVDPRA
jgi:hypothetical protein